MSELFAEVAANLESYQMHAEFDDREGSTAQFASQHIGLIELFNHYHGN